MPRKREDVVPLDREGMFAIASYACDGGVWGGRGALMGAYWVPPKCGAQLDRAEAFLGLDGVFQAFAFGDPVLLNGAGEQWVNGPRVWRGEEKDIEDGKLLPDSVKEALRQCLIDTMLAEQAASIKPSREDGPRDEWGNLIE